MFDGQKHYCQAHLFNGLVESCLSFYVHEIVIIPFREVSLVLIYLCLFNYCVQEAELVIRIRILRMRNVKCLRQSFSKFSELPPLFHENFSWLRRVRSAIIWHQVKSILRVWWWCFIVVNLVSTGGMFKERLISAGGQGGGVRGVGRVLAKLQRSIEAGNYYEAHQMYKTLYFRYL